ncbi:MAG TPA: hypothetical protein VLJ42_09905 [Solirubrobacteraceae bacterium]|nr:hypothetical protein [Solirubrobacteraceae bacterium]
MAVRQSSGDVYATDPGHLDPGDGTTPAPRVQIFDAAGVSQGEFLIDAGTYSSPGAVAIGPVGASDVVYVGAVNTAASSGAVLRYDTAGVAGTPLTAGPGSTFANPVVLAVDPVDGTVYASAVATGGAPVIEKFNSAGVFQASFDGSSGAPGGVALAAVSGLAIDGADRLYVSDGAKVYRYSAAGAYQLTVDDPSADGFPVRGIAADANSNEVYVNEPNDNGFTGRVRVFSAAGVQTQQAFTTPSFGFIVALAINDSSKMAYLGDTNNQAGARFAAFVGPTVTTTTGSTIDPSSETLHGTINPQGIAGTTAHFEYGPDTNYGSLTPDIDPGSGSAAVPVTDTASGLLPNSVYHFRVVGVNGSGTIFGSDSTFTTAPAAPLVDGSPPFASAITPNGAALNGTVDAQGSDTSYHFEYGVDTSYGSVTTPDGGPLSGQGAQPASSPVTGLQPNTTYHFRIVADNGTGGPQAGADQIFITAPAAAAGATDITTVRALLTGTVNPHGSPATYHFEYTSVTPSPVVGTTAEADAGTDNADTPVTASSGSLAPGTTYTVHVVLTDTGTGVTTTGVDGTFTTDPAPTAATGAVTGVMPSAATFAGSYDTHGHSGSYQFVVGSSTSSYLATTDPVAVSGAGTASGSLGSLPAGQTYKVRLSVTSDGATVLGDVVTFSTPAEPVTPPPPPSSAVAPVSPYGCHAPHLNAVDTHPKVGSTVTVTGTDLGVGGTVALGNGTVDVTGWTATGFSLVIPDGATGTLPLTVNCGNVSNTVGVAIFQDPGNGQGSSNGLSIKSKVKSTTATLSVKVPGPGKLQTSSSHTTSTTKTVTNASTAKCTVRLNKAGKKALAKAKSRKLKVTIRVRYTPTGGTPITDTKTVTYTRKAAH